VKQSSHDLWKSSPDLEESSADLRKSSERRSRPDAVLLGLLQHVERLLHGRGRKRAHVDDSLPSSFRLPQVVSRTKAVGSVTKADGDRLLDVGRQPDAVVRKNREDREWLMHVLR
jgi:hypothetical protein